MNRPAAEMARLGSNFDRALASAIAQQASGVAERILGALERGDYSVEVAGTPPVIVLRIAGDVLLECFVYEEPADVKVN